MEKGDLQVYMYIYISDMKFAQLSCTGQCLVESLMCLQKVVKTAKVYTYVKYNAISYIVILYARRLTASQMKQVTTGAHMNTCITLMVVDVTSHLIPIDKHYHSTVLINYRD